MLLDTAKIFDKCKIDYVLEAGTLLGIVREDRLLPWDNDIDITITKKFQEVLLRNRWRFWFKGYRTRVKYYKKVTGPFKKGEVRMMKLQKLGPFKKLNLVDIFIKKLIDDEYFWTIAPKRPVLKSVPKKYYEEFTRINYEGYEYMAPKDYEGFLTYCYGDWKTVVKDWNFRTGDNCVREEIE